MIHLATRTQGLSDAAADLLGEDCFRGCSPTEPASVAANRSAMPTDGCCAAAWAPVAPDPTGVPSDAPAGAPRQAGGRRQLRSRSSAHRGRSHAR